MNETKPATMAQIAEHAGVALSTVSYVLSGRRPVSPVLRERVLAAVEALEYRPHGPARALASGNSHTIALFLPSPRWQLIPVQQTFVAGVTQETSANDYGLLLVTSPVDPEAIARTVAMGRADGVILMETLAHDPRVERLRAAGHPFTLIGRTADTTGISFVDLEQRSRSRRASRISPSSGTAVSRSSTSPRISSMRATTLRSSAARRSRKLRRHLASEASTSPARIPPRSRSQSRRSS